MDTDSPDQTRLVMASAYSKLSREDATRQYPELQKAYELEAAVAFTVRKLLQPSAEAEQRFAERTRLTIASNIGVGKSFELKPEAASALRTLGLAEEANREAIRDDARARSLIRSAATSGVPDAEVGARLVEINREHDRRREADLER